MFTVSLHRRAEKFTFAPLLSAGNIAIVVSLAAHVGFAAVAIQHARGVYRADLRASREPPGEVRADDVDLLEQAEPAREPEHGAAAQLAPAAPRAAAAQPAAAVPRSARASEPTAVSPSEATSVGTVAVPLAAPRFAMLAPTVNASAASHAGGAVAASSAHGAGDEQAGPFAESSVDAPAKLVSGAPPSYTPAAESAGVEAEVPLEVVINAAGAVEDARSLSHVGYGLDEAALSAVRSYRFAPARRDNQRVAVRMRWLMRFQLR